MTPPDIKHVRIPWNPSDESDKPLGRHVEHDPRSLNFLAEQATKIRTVRHRAHGLPLTQTRGSCTAEAFCGALDSDPDFTGHELVQSDADSLYDQEIIAQGLDPKVDDPGGTGLLVCKAGQQMGLIRSYTHAIGLTATLQALVLRPVIIGINWWSSFDEPDQYGRITLTTNARIRGGHEVLLDEINTRQKDVGAWNSWGPDWGYKGRFRIKWDLLDRLLAEDGDATVPIV